MAAVLLFVGLGAIFLVTDAYAAATLSVTPSSQSVTVGTTLPVEVRLNTGGDAVNTVTANLTFSKDKIRLQSVSTTGSFLTIWFELPDTESEVVTANNNGEIRITGSLPTPGQSGSNSLIAKLTFVPIAAGSATLNFASTSAVYRNSDNTNIVGTSNTGGTYTISEVAPTATPTLAPTSSPTPTPTVPPGTGNGKLPDVGIETPTFFLFTLALLLISSGFWLLRAI